MLLIPLIEGLESVFNGTVGGVVGIPVIDYEEQWGVAMDWRQELGGGWLVGSVHL